jgi:hypothetical protein
VLISSKLGGCCRGPVSAFDVVGFGDYAIFGPNSRRREPICNHLCQLRRVHGNVHGQKPKQPRSRLGLRSDLPIRATREQRRLTS